ncbi:hypothetical protein R7D66_05025 [Vibrio sp. Vb2354]|uniref:hypothetical protein n=1 Tax=unclassified Vibrio TaxID=2614977 RepID=UPI0029656259|nr:MULTISPECIES: hypothetical protein [unclassified Vibrio]MDW1737809.1 hypothetical protein [Vibrio sp. Vb2321]MDW1756935.1 hypothetical protein [Vibrio sp. Vb2353]MDW1771238.1 hypothetical protein [Vibrio sp. Vb2354]MDW1807562.1 hypothetical protein [Vibrio sp. Vb2362]
MSAYSKRERAIASLLARFPTLKSYLKRIYTNVFYALYKPDFDYKIKQTFVLREVDSSSGDTFFGYYDKSPESSDGRYILFQRASGGTVRSPKFTADVEVVVVDRESKQEVISLKSRAFNWQQGTKLQWLSNECFIFNDYENGEYVSRIVDLEVGKVVDTLPLPIYDTFVGESEYALTTSFERLSIFAPDYGYFAKVLDNNLKYSCDGVYWISLKTGDYKQIVSLEQLSAFEFNNSLGVVHTVNHIMISPSGKQFIFIHRWYIDGQRFDRLLLSDLAGNLRVLADDGMVSHCCWADDHNVTGFFRHNSENNYFNIDLKTSSISPYSQSEYTDGHPTVNGSVILTDTYPNRKGLQELMFLDEGGRKNILGEFKHSPRYFGESRCDLHPRLSCVGNRIYFDSVCTGIRKLYYLEKQ